MKPRVLILGAVDAPTLAALEQGFDCRRQFESGAPLSAADSTLSQYRIVVTNSVRGISADELQKLPALALVASLGVGLDAIPLEACRSRGVAVTYTPDVLTEDVADLAMALLLAAIRRICVGDRFVREGLWARGRMPLTATLQNRKVGIVGLGRIGSAIARRCGGFNCEVAYHGPRRKAGAPYPYFGDPVSLARWSDVLIAACCGGEETRGIVSRQALEALGPEGFFINVARGEVVDEDALVDLLQTGGLAGAGLDVFAHEPEAPQALLRLDNVVLQPHQGSATHHSRLAMGRLVLANIEAFVAGRPLVSEVPAPAEAA